MPHDTALVYLAIAIALYLRARQKSRRIRATRDRHAALPERVLLKGRV